MRLDLQHTEPNAIYTDVKPKPRLILSSGKNASNEASCTGNEKILIVDLYPMLAATRLAKAKTLVILDFLMAAPVTIMLPFVEMS